MVNTYLDEISDSLSINELSVLGLLTDHHADATFKSMKRGRLMELSNLSISDFRKVINRLEITKFIGIVYGQKEHKIFITEFGQYALAKSLEKIEDGRETEQITEQSPPIRVRQIKSFANKGN
jgi:predicted transcriptional regulator